MAGAARKTRWSWLLLALLLAFPSVGFIQKHSGLAGVAVYVAVVMSGVWLTCRFGPVLAPWCRRFSRVLGVLAFAGLAVVFAVVYPIENGKGPGKSSDRDDGLNLAVTRMVEGKSPYYPPAVFPGPLSLLPGSIFLAAPFAALGNSAYQNIIWLAVFLFAVWWSFKDPALALCLLVVPLALSPSAQYEYISGGDMQTNGIYVAVFFLLAIHVWSAQQSSWLWRVAASVLLGMGLASRSNFLLLLPLFGAVLWRSVGFRRALVAATFAGVVAVAISLPFFLHDPAGFTPLLTRYKLALVDDVMPWASKAMVGMTVLTGVTGAWVLLRAKPDDMIAAFFRWCTVVTLCPMVCAVLLYSLGHQHLDFCFMRDRFGLMYVPFALLGWGARLLGDKPVPA